MRDIIFLLKFESKLESPLGDSTRSEFPSYLKNNLTLFNWLELYIGND